MIWATAASLLVFGVVGAAAAKPGHRSKRGTGQPLNVVVILSDDERSDGTAVMKNTQRLLADHGVTFTGAHVTTSMCGPSRASILTGQYAHHTGVTDNFGPNSYPAFKAGEESNDLGVWMRDAGYETALVGKYVNAYTGASVNHYVPPGWDDWQVMDSIPMEAYYNYTINNNGRLEQYGNRAKDYSTTVLTHKAVRFIHQARHPFFLYFAPVAPHLPAIPAPADRGKLENIAPIHDPAFNQRNIGKEPWRFWHKDLLSAAAQLYINHIRIKQEESLLSLDRSVRSVVQALKARHELNRTVILYTSDNGFLWGEHRLGGKVWPFEESTHVPLIVRTPWTTTPVRNNQPVLNIDIAPTDRRAGRDQAGPPAGRQEPRSLPERRAGSVAARLARGVPRQGPAQGGWSSFVRRRPDETEPLGRVQERLAGALQPPEGPVGAEQPRGRPAHQSAPGEPQRGPRPALRRPAGASRGLPQIGSGHAGSAPGGLALAVAASRLEREGVVAGERLLVRDRARRRLRALRPARRSRRAARARDRRRPDRAVPRARRARARPPHPHAARRHLAGLGREVRHRPRARAGHGERGPRLAPCGRGRGRIPRSRPVALRHDRLRGTRGQRPRPLAAVRQRHRHGRLALGLRRTGSASSSAAAST